MVILLWNAYIFIVYTNWLMIQTFLRRPWVVGEPCLTCRGYTVAPIAFTPPATLLRQNDISYNWNFLSQGQPLRLVCV